jgi:hypothetical protein
MFVGSIINKMWFTSIPKVSMGAWLTQGGTLLLRRTKKINRHGMKF